MRLRPPAVARRRPAGDRVVFVGLLAVLAWLPLPWGSNPEWARALFGVAVCGLVVARLLLARLQRASLPELTRSARLALGLGLAWLGWIVLQLVPLPANLLGGLSPRSREVHDALVGIPGVTPPYTISLLPGATLAELLLSVALLGLFWLTLVSVATRRRRQRAVLVVLLLSGLAQAVYGIVMTLSGWELGFLASKTHNIGYTTGTFVNQNHFAAYLGLSLACGVALVLADLRPHGWRGWRDALDGLTELALSPRFRVRVTLAVLVIALVLTRSRMGNAAFFFALALCGSVYMLIRHRKYFAPALALFASIFLVDLWIVSDRYGLERLAQRLEQTDLRAEGRTALFAEVAPLVPRYLATGSGLGTFAAAFSPARPDGVRVWYDHAHNEHLQFLIEVGLPGYLVLAALAGLVVWHGWLLVARRRDPVPCALGFAGAMAVCGVVLHGAADFILHIPAVAATLVAIAALSLSSSSVPSESRPTVEATDQPPGSA